MYDKSLEQLIDAVIADGVITDQERKVVYKKAATLGIDQDEIEVYLEGRLQQHLSIPKQSTNKHGNVKVCPNCGALWISGTTKCKECGYILSNVSANSSAILLDERLKRASGARAKAHVISSFPIPHSREDLIEFLTSLEPKTKGMVSSEGEKSIRKAYIEKFNECLNKATILYPEDRIISSFVAGIKRQKTTKKVLIMMITAIIIALVGYILYYAVSYYNEQNTNLQNAKTEFINQVNSYNKELIDQIDALPTPNKNNFKECIKLFTSIRWSKSIEWDTQKWGEETIPIDVGKINFSFRQKQIAYATQIGQAMKDAGIKDIPFEYLDPALYYNTIGYEDF